MRYRRDYAVRILEFHGTHERDGQQEDPSRQTRPGRSREACREYSQRQCA
jgi:hypothetical protein